ncbi:hypothetical protein DID88_007346 [Monilinia fructigena]|uniref:Importin N-terminal domain-containing protein n=1 Tax=Monilinia fructigena TaxID=38457 RepID=A0A395JAF9_9HELO|nr:hypothetical protein DID88_007346 [Monilinia fructigena]
MDVAVLRGRIASTLDPDADTRRRAELDLKIKEHPGFTDALLDIYYKQNKILQFGYQRFVYLKNRVTRAWLPSETQPKPMADDEKARFRDRLLPFIASSPAQIRQQLVPPLRYSPVYNVSWLYAAFFVSSLERIVQNFEAIVEATFPRLLTIGQGLVNEMSEEAGEMLHIVLKAYKHATFFDLSSSLREHAVVGARKNSADIFSYGNPTSLSKGNGDEYAAFAKSFETNFAPEILKGYLQQIEKWVAKTTWLSRPCLSYTLVFLDECVRPKQMWAHLKPHLDSLVTHFVFPVMCLSPDDVEKFETDPEEYLHHKLNFYEEVSAPDNAATNFFDYSHQGSQKAHFHHSYICQFDRERIRGCGRGKEEPHCKGRSLENDWDFVQLPKHSRILRARACDTVEKFEQLDFKDTQNLLVIYRNILECMADPDLPVRVEAALALQPLIRHDIIRTSMQSNIPQIMQQLLKLANEVDVDALSNVMEDFVEVFAAELTPFAVALSEQLRDTYLRIVRELLEKNEKREDDEYGDYLDDKSITALGVLQTIGTLILTLESTPDVLLHMESILMPVIKVTLENKLYDLYNEVFEIIDSCTFAAKSISPTMWQAFELIHATFKAGAELYLEDMLPALDNFVQYGSVHLVQTPQYLDAMFGMVADMFADEKVGGVDKICACKLAEGMMLSLRGHIDQYVLQFVDMAMRTLTNTDVKVKSYKIHLMEMVINAIYYNPALTLHILEQKQWTNKFFSLWFASIDSFTRVHDKKLSIAAIVSLLTLSADQVPVSVQQGWPRLLQGIVRLFQTLPTATMAREEALKDDFPVDGESYDDDEDDEWAGDDNAWGEEGDEADEESDIKDESSAYLEFLSEEASKFNNLEDHDSDDELGEESLLETPLDKVEPYQLFKNALMKLQQEQPQLYESLTTNLNPSEQEIVQGVIHQADANAAAAIQLAQAEAQLVGVINGGA